MNRNILHHHNTKCSNKTKASIQKVVGKDVQLQLDHNGQIVMGKLITSFILSVV